MERLVKGEIIVVEFPYSNIKEVKRRPVLVLKIPKGNDIIVLQMTSSSYEKPVEILIRDEDFEKGKLKRNSYVRIDKIASVEKSLIKYKVGSLKKEKFEEIIDKVCYFLKNE